MNADPVERLTLWLLEQLEVDSTQLELLHVTERGGVSCGTWAIAGRVGEIDAGQAAARIAQAASVHTDAFAMPQTFQVRIAPQGKSFALRVQPDPRAGALAPTEDTTARGQISQLQRHTEALSRTLVELVRGTQGHAAEELSESRKMIRELLQSQRADLDQRVEIAAKLADRELERMKVERQQARLDRGADKVIGLLPMVASGVAAKLGVKTQTQPAAESLMIEGLMETLTAEQFDRMLEALDPMQQLHLLKIWESIRDRREAEAKGGNA